MRLILVIVGVMMAVAVPMTMVVMVAMIMPVIVGVLVRMSVHRPDIFYAHWRAGRTAGDRDVHKRA